MHRLIGWVLHSMSQYGRARLSCKRCQNPPILKLPLILTRLMRWMVAGALGVVATGAARQHLHLQGAWGGGAGVVGEAAAAASCCLGGEQSSGGEHSVAIGSLGGEQRAQLRAPQGLTTLLGPEQKKA